MLSIYGIYLGSPSWTRTNDTAVNSRVLYRLSYGGIYKQFLRIALVTRAGIEPTLTA